MPLKIKGGLKMVKNTFTNGFGVTDSYIYSFIGYDKHRKCYFVYMSNGFQSERVFLSKSYEDCRKVLKFIKNNDDINDFYTSLRDLLNAGENIEALLKMHNSFIKGLINEINHRYK